MQETVTGGTGEVMCVFLISCLVLQIQPPVESTTWIEPQWSKWLAETYGGETEHRLPDGSRIDILTPDVAWEVEWSDKWKEAIGQALYYSVASGRSPGVWMILRGRHDEDYLRCLLVVSHLRSKGIDIRFKIQRRP